MIVRASVIEALVVTVRIMLSDKVTGIGISPEARRKIFQHFAQAVTTPLSTGLQPNLLAAARWPENRTLGRVQQRFPG